MLKGSSTYRIQEIKVRSLVRPRTSCLIYIYEIMAVEEEKSVSPSYNVLSCFDK